MKKLTSVLLSALLTCLVFSAVLYTSCSKSSGISCGMTICKNGGICKDGKCVCPTGYEGTLCEKYDACKVITCQHNGTCVDGTCKCPEGFSGQYCEIDACASMDCINGGCRNGKCNCNPGYEGKFCEVWIKEKFLGTWKGTSDCNDPGEVITILIKGNTGTSLPLAVMIDYKSSTDSFQAMAQVDGNKLVPLSPSGNDLFYMTIDGNNATYNFKTNVNGGQKSNCAGQVAK
ncbi:calcium-binding EGF-like domain-containing protein [Polluticoccus soli]|uniref:calcium-binding EGF-like domain-containing protein n=1 Tax=Polluticoccus soli TaxID=3034150 RepID=UPI0023E2B43E|nr:calcium-binding EGF-like domain-containing protein [Flavipsychrobacter sp. JY13-12]